MSLYWIGDQGASYVVDYDGTVDGFAVYGAAESAALARQDWSPLQLSATETSRLFVATRSLIQLQSSVPGEAAGTEEAVDAALSLSRWDLASTVFDTFAKGLGAYIGASILGGGNPAAGLATLSADDLIELGVELAGKGAQQIVLYEGVGLSEQAMPYYGSVMALLPPSAGASESSPVEVSAIEEAWDLRNEAFSLSQLGSQLMFNVALDEALSGSTWDTLKGWFGSLVEGAAGVFVDTNLPIPVELTELQANVLSFTTDAARLVQLGEWSIDALDLLADRYGIGQADFGPLNFDRFTDAFASLVPANGDVGETGDNVAPVVTGAETVSLALGETLSGSELYTNITDANGQSDVALVKFWDSTPGTGYLTLDGVKQAVIAVSPAELGRVAYVAGGQSGTNQIIVEAFDQAGADSNDLRVTLQVGEADPTLPEPGGVSRLFGDPMQLSPETASEMAWLAAAAYDEGVTLAEQLAPHNWTPLNASSLGISGLYFDSHGYYSLLNAQGFAAVRGDTLAIAFRGTEPLGPDLILNDILLNYGAEQGGFLAYYQALGTLIESALAYANAHANIEHIVVAGHSLGGAAVEFLAHDLTTFATSLEGATIVADTDPGVLTYGTSHSDRTLGFVFEPGESLQFDSLRMREYFGDGLTTTTRWRLYEGSPESLGSLLAVSSPTTTTSDPSTDPFSEWSFDTPVLLDASSSYVFLHESTAGGTTWLYGSYDSTYNNYGVLFDGTTYVTDTLATLNPYWHWPMSDYIGFQLVDHASYGLTGADISFLTIGSPGTLFADDLGALPGVVQIGHTQDPVKNLADGEGIDLFVDQGRPVSVDLPNVEPRLIDAGTTEHGSVLYVRTVEYIADSTLYDYTTPTTRVVVLSTLDSSARDDSYQVEGGSTNTLVLGLSGNDTLSGSTGVDLLDGGSGDDALYGMFGDDVLAGGAGRDVLAGGYGNDTVLGGLDADVVGGGEDADLVDGGGERTRLRAAGATTPFTVTDRRSSTAASVRSMTS